MRLATDRVASAQSKQGELQVVRKRTVLLSTSSGRIGRIAFNTFTFSSRTASASKELGGSIATRARSWNMWFWIMSRSTPAAS